MTEKQMLESEWKFSQMPRVNPHFLSQRETGAIFCLQTGDLWPLLLNLVHTFAIHYYIPLEKLDHILLIFRSTSLPDPPLLPYPPIPFPSPQNLPPYFLSSFLFCCWSSCILGVLCKRNHAVTSDLL